MVRACPSLKISAFRSRAASVLELSVTAVAARPRSLICLRASLSRPRVESSSMASKFTTTLRSEERRVGKESKLRRPDAEVKYSNDSEQKDHSTLAEPGHHT